MKSTSLAGLSRKTLEASLTATTERLATELAAPSAVAPEWSESEWLMARAVATIHGTAPLLRSTLRWRGPEGWERFLSRERTLEQQRHRRMTELLGLIHEELHTAGVPAVALKGSALYGAGLYGPGERPMADVDVLVRRTDCEPAAKVFEALGFQESWRFWKNRVFCLREGEGFWRPPEPGEQPIKIELHERICERLPARLADISRYVFPEKAEPGLNPYPSRASLIGHLLLHAAGAIVERSLRLIQLYDIALLAPLATSDDWTEVFGIGESGQAPWWAFPAFVLADRYFPRRIPQSALKSARAGCPAILSRISVRQTLSDVSLSFPWIEAFPGIVWSRSPTEALEYVAQRFLSGTEASTYREVASRTEPGLSARERNWLAVSQGERILRWLISRPARPETMRAVRSAFGVPA